MICRAQVSGWTVDVIIDSGSSTSIISKGFLDHIKRKVTKSSTRKIIGIHGEQKSSLGIIKEIAVHLGDVVIFADMEVINTNVYNMVLSNDWFRRA